MARRIVLQYFIILLAIDGHHSSVLNSESLGIISQLLRKDSRDPLIVVVDSSKKIRAVEDDSYDEVDRNAAIETSRENAINHDKVNENYDTVLYNVLRTSNVIVEDEDAKEDKRKEIEKGIRQRCQARVVCTEKCSAENTALRKRYCQKSCKAVFDYLVRCPPPGNEWKKKKKPPPPPPPPPKDSCASDSCASKNSCDSDSCKPKNSCDSDSCKPKNSCNSDSCKSKDSCQSSDSCNPKDSCGSNDSCNLKTTAKRPRTGKTYPPTWRY